MNTQLPPPTKRRTSLRMIMGILVIVLVVWSAITNPPQGSGATFLGQLTFILIFLTLGIWLVGVRSK